MAPMMKLALCITAAALSGAPQIQADPANDLIAIFMTQVLPSSAYPLRRELRTMVYAAITESNL